MGMDSRPHSAGQGGYGPTRSAFSWEIISIKLYAHVYCIKGKGSRLKTLIKATEDVSLEQRLSVIIYSECM